MDGCFEISRKWIAGRVPAVFLLLIVAILTGVAGVLLCGSVDIPAAEVIKVLTGGETAKESWRIIILETRVPMAVTAAMAGSALAVAGLLLQTCFNNPLAGPSILGISTGASLGVAVVVLFFGGMIGPGMGRYVSIMIGALLGALMVMMLLLLLSRVVGSALMLLIAGILVGYFSSSAISLLNYYSSADSVYSFTIWGLGSFGGGSSGRVAMFSSICLPLVVISMLFVKPLNAMLLGERYAASVGVDMRRVRLMLLLVTGLLTAVVTAFCGPIAFLGLIVPHMTRLLLRTSNHTSLLPATALCGAATALLCAWLSVGAATTGVIPINAITPVIGVPIVIYVIINRGRLLYFD